LIRRLRIDVLLQRHIIVLSLAALFYGRNPVPVVRAFLEDVALRCDDEARRLARSTT